MCSTAHRPGARTCSCCPSPSACRSTGSRSGSIRSSARSLVSSPGREIQQLHLVVVEPQELDEHRHIDTPVILSALGGGTCSNSEQLGDGEEVLYVPLPRCVSAGAGANEAVDRLDVLGDHVAQAVLRVRRVLSQRGNEQVARAIAIFCEEDGAA